MKRSAVRIALLTMLLALLPSAAQGQTRDGTTGGSIADPDPYDEVWRKRAAGTRLSTFAALARAARSDSLNAMEYEALAEQARVAASEAARRAETARRLAEEASCTARADALAPDKCWEKAAAQRRAAELREQEAALWEQEAKAWDRASEGGAMIHGELRLCPFERPAGTDRNPTRSESCREVAIR